jgi:hypothetical protein
MIRFAVHWDFQASPDEKPLFVNYTVIASQVAPL